MRHAVIDIETLGIPLASFDEVQQRYLMKFASTDAERQEAQQKLSLYPLTAQIIAIGLLDPQTGEATVWYQAPGTSTEEQVDGTARLVTGSEPEILERFWAAVEGCQQIITFNGRGFDCPFLLLRSAMLGIVPTCDLMPYRYDPGKHCDLLEQFTFYGAVRRFDLDFYCKAFGIDSPKAHGITGMDLERLFSEGHYRDIASYNLGDLQATASLFRVWERFLVRP